ncbi:MAG: amino acid adenylation domain-containing protein, partial [Algicola sp.]|nr:amino acid adenylation domain-containing protein [Algicola sp.]
NRSPDMVIAILAILKAGGAYVPLDPAYPKKRLDYMVKDSGIELVLSQISVEMLANVDTIWLDDDLVDELSTNLPNVAGPDSLAYVIYTSGSTGQPKGVMVEHRGVVNYLTHVSNHYFNQQPEPATGSVVSSSLNFDATITSLLSPLVLGKSAQLLSEADDSLTALAKVMFDATKPLLFKITPAHLEGISHSVNNTQTCLINHCIVVGGEQLSVALMKQLTLLLPNTTFINEYGPTETVVGCSTYTVTGASDLAKCNTAVPIGKPIQNTQLYVLNDQGKLQPKGQAGELYIGGAGVSRGYLHRPDLTAERFVDNPFAAGSYNRLYKTGDKVRYLTNGNLEFIGRMDEQVKIRGFRIELGEIEHQLAQLPQVNSTVVVALDHQLVAYITCSDEVGSTDVFKAHLQAVLPAHMVPAHFVVLDTIPLTPNGKVDKKALAAPDTASLLGEHVTLQGDTEQKLGQIWSSLLNIDIDKLGGNANFFTLGGDSIVSIQMVSRAAQLGIHFSVKQLFEFQTIGSLAAQAESSVRVMAVQTPITGELTLLPVQLEFFADETDLHHYNQAVMLTTPNGFKADYLPQIVRHLYQRHDALRIRFARGQTHWTGQHQALSEAMVSQSIEQITLKTADFSDIDSIAQSMQASLSLADGPLFKAVLFTNATDTHANTGINNESRLLLIIHHLVVDGVSWRIILADIESLFKKLLSQQGQNIPLSLPPKTSSYQQWGEFLTEYATSEALLKEREYWHQVVSHDVPALPFEQQALNRQEATATGTAKVRFELDEITTTQLVQQAGLAYRTQINELLLAGLLLGFNRWSGNTSLGIDLEGHGREALSQTLDLNQTVGWFTSIYPLTLNTPKADIKSIICSVKESHRAIPNRGIGFGVLKYLAKDEVLNNAPSADILFNYLGQFDQALGGDFKMADESTGDMVSANRAPSHGLVFNGMITHQQLGFDLTYDCARFNAHDIETLAENLRQALTDIVEHCLEADAGCLTPADFPLANLNANQLQQWVDQYSIEDIYPATDMQQGLLYHSRLDEGAYVTQIMFNYETTLNTVYFKQAWQQVVDRHPSLRAIFVTDDAGVMQQLISSHVQLPWIEHDLSHLDAGAQSDFIEAQRLLDKADSFDIETAPLMRMHLWLLGPVGKEGQPHCKIMMSNHHALLDGWCMSLLLRELNSIYQGLKNDTPIDLPRQRPYRDYVAWVAEQDVEKAKAFWQQQLAGIEAPTALPEREKRRKEKGVGETHLGFNEQQTAQLVQLAKQTRTSVNILLQGAYSYVLSKYANENSVIFGATVSGRPPALIGVESMVGLFINTLPVRVDIAHDTPLKDWLQQLYQAQAERDEYGYLGLNEIQQLSDFSGGVEGVAGSAPLFDSLMVFENYPIDDSIGLNIDQVQSFEDTNYGLTLTVTLTQTLDITLQSKRAQFGDESAVQLLAHIQNVLNAMMAKRDVLVGELGMLSDAEKHRLTDTLNDTKVDYPTHLCVHQMFEQQVLQTPDNIAVCYDQQQLSYQTLNKQANQLAHYLIEQGVTTDVLVGVSLNRGIDMIVAVLAVLKAGGAYVPLDPQYPAQRLAYMTQDSGIKLLLDQKNLADLPNLQDFDVSNPSTSTGPGSLAYVIYTSGSTGQPKGVMVEHGGVVNYLDHVQKAYFTDAIKGSVVSSSLNFDATVTSVFGPLTQGGFVQLLPQDQAEADNTLEALTQLVFDATEPLLFKITPAHLEGIAHLAKTTSDVAHRFVIGGAQLTVKLVELLKRDVLPQAVFVNEYGPTEAVVGCTTFTVETLADLNTLSVAVPIGTPIQNTQMYVLDKQRKLQPSGAVGELYIGGEGVTRGYLNQPELTVERFVQTQYGRLYKTGDHVKYLPSGCLVFVGRVDEQVKIRGYRIELGEIEHQLSQLPPIKSAIVVAQDDNLVAYFTAEKLTGEPLNVEEIEYALKAQLPAHMVPAFYVILDQLPLTPNGKIDTKALPAPHADLVDAPQALQTASEIKLAKIWCKLLKIDNIDGKVNFFKAGGHSLLSVRLVGEVRANFGVELAIRDIFESPQLADLAALIDSRKGENTRSPIVPIERCSLPQPNQLPTSFAQQRLWFIDQMDGASSQYNMPSTLILNGEFDEEIVQQA